MFVFGQLGGEGVHVCVELCARALQLCDMQADIVTRSLVCKTIAFLLPHDLEICRACALLVFCQERSLEAYRIVCLLYMHPDEEPHPHNSPVRTNVRFHILQVGGGEEGNILHATMIYYHYDLCLTFLYIFVFQMLKERLCFDPEFWNLLTLRTHCLELMSDKVMKAAVLSEMKEEEEKECSEELLINNCVNDSCTQGFDSCQCTEAAVVKRDLPEEQTMDGETEKCAALSNDAHLKRRKWRRRLRRRQQSKSDDEADIGDDPEIKYNLKSTSLSNKPVYSLRRNHTNMESSASVKFPLNRKREYLSRCVKSQILKRKGKKKRWLQGLPRLEQVPTVKEKKVKVRGRKRGWKPSLKLELSYPDNEIFLTEEEFGFKKTTDTEDKKMDMPDLENELKQESEQIENQLDQKYNLEKDNGLEEHTDMDCGSGVIAQNQEDSQTQLGSKLCEGPPREHQAAVPAVEADPELDGPPLDLFSCPIEQFHSYCLKLKNPDSEKVQPPESSASDVLNGDTEQEPQPTVETEMSNAEVSCVSVITLPGISYCRFIITGHMYSKLMFYLLDDALNKKHCCV